MEARREVGMKIVPSQGKLFSCGHFALKNHTVQSERHTKNNLKHTYLNYCFDLVWFSRCADKNGNFGQLHNKTE